MGTTCAGCGAEIFWIVTPRGRKAPLDVKPKVVWVQDGDGWRLVRGHESHHATCPKAKDFKGGQG